MAAGVVLVTLPVYFLDPSHFAAHLAQPEAGQGHRVTVSLDTSGHLNLTVTLTHRVAERNILAGEVLVEAVGPESGRRELAIDAVMPVFSSEPRHVRIQCRRERSLPRNLSGLDGARVTVALRQEGEAVLAFAGRIDAGRGLLAEVAEVPAPPRPKLPAPALNAAPRR